MADPVKPTEVSVGFAANIINRINEKLTESGKTGCPRAEVSTPDSLSASAIGDMYEERGWESWNNSNRYHSSIEIYMSKKQCKEFISAGIKGHSEPIKVPGQEAEPASPEAKSDSGESDSMVVRAWRSLFGS